METSALLIFTILSIPVIYVSRKSILRIKSHGFYRFLSWECILLLFANNYRFWFVDPFSPGQIVSWIFLIYSIYPALAGSLQLRRAKKTDTERDEKELFRFEKTSELVTNGIFRYIRHPLYSSLLFLTWGIFLKNTGLGLFIVAACSSVFLYLTARRDEKECLAYFGSNYESYMRGTKMFIPFIV